MRGLVPTTTARTPHTRTSGGWLVFACSFIWWIAMSQLLGCAPTRDFMSLEIRQGRPMLKKTFAEAERLRVAVVPFGDRRADTGLIGFRRDWLGRKTPFTVEGGGLGDSIAEVLVEDVKSRRGWQAWISKPGVLEPEEGPDVRLHGTILAFEASATPAFGGTDLAATVRIEINAQHAVDQRSFVARAEAMESRRVFWFERHDLAGLVNATIRRAIDQFMSQLVVDGRSLQQKN